MSRDEIGFSSNFQEPTSPLLQSDDAFRLYLTALIKSGNSQSINFAVNRRDTLLSKIAGDQVDLEPTAASNSVDNSVSTSRKVAQNVIANNLHENTAPSTETQSAISSQSQKDLSAALAAGSGLKENPIHVMINERQSFFSKDKRFYICLRNFSQGRGISKDCSFLRVEHNEWVL